MECLWERHKQTIRDLYLVKDMKKTEVAEEMAKRGFQADEGQFERQFKKWNFRKNLTRKEWHYASRVVAKRKREGKESDLKIDGISVPRKKVQKAISRYGQGSTLQMIQRELGRGQRDRSLTPIGLVVYTPPASVSPGFSTDYLPWLNFYTKIKSHLQSEGRLCHRIEDIVHQQSKSVWSQAVRAAIPISHLDLRDSKSSNICSDIIQGSGFNKFAFSVLLASNRMDDIFANITSTSVPLLQPLGKVILRHLRCPTNFPVFEFLIVQHDETIEALSEIMFKEALLEMNVGLVKLLLRCFKVDADALLPGPWRFSPQDNPSRFYSLPYPLLPLEVAIKAKNVPMARVLLKQGASIFSNTRDGHTMVALALDSTQDILHSILDSYQCSDPTSNFLRAVCLGLSRDIEKLLVDGMDPDTSDHQFGGPALAIAIKREHFHITHLLLNAGAKVNVYNCVNESPLLLAVEHQNLELVRNLLDLGAELEYESTDTGKGTTHIIRSAVGNGNLDLTTILLEHGANPNAGLAWFLDQLEPIESLMDGEHTSLAELLLRHDAHVDSWALKMAIHHQCPGVMQLFLDHGVSLTIDTLHEAVKAGNMEMVKLSLDAGVDINGWCESHDYVRPQCSTAVTIAIREVRGSFEMVSFLINSGANINHPAADPTALEAAIKTGNTELIDFLLQRGAYFDHPGVLEAATRDMEPLVLQKLMDAIANQDTPRHSHRPCLYHPALAAAAECGSLEKVMIILQHAVKIGKPCSVRALQQCKSNSLPILRKLLAADIPVNVPPNLASFPCIGPFDVGPRISPVQHFAMSGNDEAVQLLLEHGADPNFTGDILTLHGGTRFKRESVFSTVAANCGTEVVEAVLNAGAVVNPPVLGSFERTPLQNAAEHGRLENMELILRAGGDVNAPAAEYGGVTALQASAIQGTLGIAIRLLEAGADVNAPVAKEQGRTALEGAAEYGRIDMIQLLLNAGADIESPQFGILQYRRAVEMARENGHNAAARLLEKHRSSLGSD